MSYLGLCGVLRYSYIILGYYWIIVQLHSICLIKLLRCSCSRKLTEFRRKSEVSGGFREKFFPEIRPNFARISLESTELRWYGRRQIFREFSIFKGEKSILKFPAKFRFFPANFLISVIFCANSAGSCKNSALFRPNSGFFFQKKISPFFRLVWSQTND